MDQRPYLIALQQVKGLGPVKIRQLLDAFNNRADQIWQTNPRLLPSITQQIIDNFKQSQSTFDPLKYFQDIQAKGIKVTSILDNDYPQTLREIYDPPLLLFYQGQLPENYDKNIAIVGSRKMSGYGKLVTEKFSATLSQAGLTVVSGLARGVDTIAHQAAVENDNYTIAVLGCGLDHIYPEQNAKLASKILENGCLISEYQPEITPLPGNFPRRNRIIAGLSIGTLVTEADLNSGSLITARHSLETGREVFAVPGPITSQGSRGPHALIQNGAHLVTDPEQILDILGIQPITKTTKTLNLSDSEQQIIHHLTQESVHIDELAHRLNLSASILNATLLKLEIAGLITNLGSGNYSVKL